MITGFNTDVRHGDVVFHVQTEDKGEGNPCVESLIYVGGQILARKRSGYQSLLENEGAGAAIAKLMEEQHRSMIADIRAGNMDDKLAELQGGKVAKTEPAAPAPESARVEPPPAEPAAEPPDAAAASSSAAPAAQAEASAEAAAPQAAESSKAPAEPEIDSRTVVATPLKKLLGSPPKPPPPEPREPPPSAKAKPAAGDSSARESRSDDRSLDQVILDYLEMEAEQEKLVLSMDRNSGELMPGNQATVTFQTRSSLGGDPIGAAKVEIRLISTIGEPKVLGEGQTDDSGQLEMTLDVPELKAGTGALIITAESTIGNAELRHLI